MTEISDPLKDAVLITQSYPVAKIKRHELNRNKQQYEIFMGTCFFIVPVGKGDGIVRITKVEL
jgi:hypothetical protein